MPQTSNELFLDAVLRHQIGLAGVSEDIQKKAFRLLNDTEKDLRAEIRRRLLNKPRGLRTPGDVRRMQGLTKALRAIRVKAWAKSETDLVKAIKDVSRAEVEFMGKALQTSIPVVFDPALPSAQLLTSLVETRPFRGNILKDWAKRTRLVDVNRIEQQVRIGMVAGEDSKAIARRVVGSVSRRGADGVTEVTRRQATALTRTAVNAFSNDAKQAFYAANSDVFSEEQYISTLDEVTTPICRSLDGNQYSPGEGPIPPQHMQCRSIRVAVINGEVLGLRPASPFTESMLLREYVATNKLKSVRRRVDLPRGHKGAYDIFKRGRVRELTGQVPAKVTYQEWLTRQSAEFQNDVLGTARGKLFRDGGLTLKQFVNPKGKLISLRELIIKENAAFTRAGIGSNGFPLARRLNNPNDAVRIEGTVHGSDLSGAEFDTPTIDGGGSLATVDTRYQAFHKNTVDYVEEFDLKEATQSYMRSGYENVNGYLRKQKGFEDVWKRPEFTDAKYQRYSSNFRHLAQETFEKDLKRFQAKEKQILEQIEDIKIDMKPLKQNYHIYRGDLRKLDLQVGSIVDEQGFLSTSTYHRVSQSFSGDSTVFQMKLPKGKKAIFENGFESEAVLLPGQRWRVVEYHKNVFLKIPGADYGKTIDDFYVVELLNGP